MIKPVLNEVLQELKELKQEQAETIKVVFEIKDRVKGYEEKLSDLKIISLAVDIHPVMYAINAGLNKIKNAIETQPKSITRQFRFLLFPENNATEYYKNCVWQNIFLDTYLRYSDLSFCFRETFY